MKRVRSGTTRKQAFLPCQKAARNLKCAEQSEVSKEALHFSPVVLLTRKAFEEIAKSAPILWKLS